jgi:hypothetical protein
MFQFPLVRSAGLGASMKLGIDVMTLILDTDCLGQESKYSSRLQAARFIWNILDLSILVLNRPVASYTSGPSFRKFGHMLKTPQHTFGDLIRESSVGARLTLMRS